MKRTLAFLSTLLVSSVAFAQQAEPQLANTPKLSQYEKTFSIDLGIYNPSLSTKIRLDGPNGRGSEIDFEDDLKLTDEKAIADIMLTWKYSKRWAVQIDYVDLQRTSTGVFEEGFTWGDQEFVVDSLFAAQLDIMIARLAFGYELVDKERWGVGLILGFHMAELTAGIANRTSVNDQIIFDDGAIASTDGIFPLPNFGLAYRYIFSKDWMLSARFDVFGLEIEEWAGELYSGEVGVKYFLGDSTKWGVGIGYKFFSVAVDYDRDTWKGSFDFAYHGPKAYLSASW